MVDRVFLDFIQRFSKISGITCKVCCSADMAFDSGYCIFVKIVAGVQTNCCWSAVVVENLKNQHSGSGNAGCCCLWHYCPSSCWSVVCCLAAVVAVESKWRHC